MRMGVQTSSAQWVITLNLLVGAVVAPTVGRLSDGPHRKRLLVVCLALTAAGSVVAALAGSLSVLLVGRALQGFAYGLVPGAIAVARQHLPRERTAKAIATLSITVAMGLGFGYPLTGLTVGTLGLGGAFWVALGLVLVGLVVVLRLVPPDQAGERRPFDLPGALWLSGVLVALVLAITQAPRWGWASPGTGVLTGVAAVCAWSWVRGARRTTTAFVDLASLRVRDVAATHLGALALASTVYAAMSTSSLVVQAPTSTGYGLEVSVLVAGLVILPLSVGSIAANQVLRLALPRCRATTLLAAGAAVLLVGNASLLVVRSSLGPLVAGMAVVGLGMGLVFGSAPVVVARGVPRGEVGSAVSLNQVLRTVGGLLGSAATGSVFAATSTDLGFPSAGGVRLAHMGAVLVAGVCALGLAAVWFVHPAGGHGAEPSS
ncbi:MFS transporter [Phycicoccus sp. DTK01]|uniref:MFS transporter n=1 Tax=Phycicoccus sp. DTK01 TaxID=2785745 RepID=UPI001F5DFE3B|nr:MFS transporter [Phycicoccus sp. DTK01]